MSRQQHTTECVFELEPGWIDDTGYSYQGGPVTVVIGPYTPVAKFATQLKESLERFRMAVPSYELLEHTTIPRPVAGAELVAHRLGGELSMFELSIFWPLDETMWVFRARGPLDAEEPCKRAAEEFLKTYQPVEAP